MMRSALVLLLFAALALPSGDAEAKRRRRSGKGAVAIKCRVDGATVHVDGRKKGTTPLTEFAISAGDHKIKVTRLGFLEFTKKIRVRKGKTLRIAADLLPIAGVLRVTADRRSAITVDGKRVGTTPLNLELKPGRHRVVISAAGEKAVTKTVTARAGIDYPFDIRFAGGDDLDLGLDLTPPPDDGGGDDMDLGLDLTPPPDDSGGDMDLGLDLTPPPDDSGDDMGLSLDLTAPPDGGSGGDDLDLGLALPVGPDGDDGLGLDLSLTPPPGVGSPKPWYMQWYAWAGAGAGVAVLATTATIIFGGEANTYGYSSYESGGYGAGQAAAPGFGVVSAGVWSGSRR